MDPKTTALHFLKACFTQERERFILWVPVLIGVGIAVYFSMRVEPPIWVGVVAFPVMAGLAYCVKRTLFWLPMVAMTLACLGFTAAQFNTWRTQTLLLHEKLVFRQITGAIEDIEIQEEGKGRLVLVEPVIERFPAGQTPARIRVSIRSVDPALRVGDRVSLIATLHPLLGPVTPDGFDFARYLYFKRLGAIGYATSPVTLLQPTQKRSLQEALNQLRLHLATDMLSRLGPINGAVAAALTVGAQETVPEDINDILRDAGLYHILSISGIHLALASGIIFFSVRSLLLFSMKWALRWPVKKIAASLALLSALFYLLIAGAPVPAQRSFIMVAFVFFAILVDRKGISIYSLAWAATLLLLWKPDAMLGASFQMSFAATLAIVAFYERYAGLLYKRRFYWWSKPAVYFGAVMFTSLAATISTAPLVIFHFNRLQVWGLISNMLVEPLTAFWIMPGIVMTFLLYPFGLQHWGYAVMDSGIDWMLKCARFVADLPFASINIPSPGMVGLSLCVLGMLWLALWRGRIHVLGWVFLISGLLCSLNYTPPDMLISEDAKALMVRRMDGSYMLLKGTTRNFTTKNWLTLVGVSDVPALRKGKNFGLPEDDVYCTQGYCIYTREGVSIAIVPFEDALGAACAQEAKAVIALFPLPSYECVDAVLRIGAETLEREGAHALYVENGTITLHTAAEIRGQRPWSP